MANHPNRSTSQPSCYLWVARQSEPGCHGETFRFTANANPPPRVPSSPHYGPDGPTGLTYADSLYGEWEVLGIVKGECGTRDDPGDCVRRPDGYLMDAVEIVQCGWYSKPRAA
jgi:hypothetical protein